MALGGSGVAVGGFVGVAVGPGLPGVGVGPVVGVAVGVKVGTGSVSLPV